MYILTSDKKNIVDSGFVERFCLVEKPDACIIIASYSADRAVTVGRYRDRAEANHALFDLYLPLRCDNAWFDMPDSELFHGEHKKQDARIKRKGGS